MWIPYFLLEFWEPEKTPLEAVQASEADLEEREFEVWFFLENPPTRRREVELRLTDVITKNQIDENERTVMIRFKPDGDGLLTRVGFRIRDARARTAFRYCYDRLSQLLSFWALSTGSGYSIYGLRIVDQKHSASWTVIPQRAAPEEFFLPREIAVTPEYGAMVSLYREGRNAQSPFYRFLCCYKILEAWYRSGGMFATADKLIKERGLSLRRPRRTVTHEMLVMSLVFASHPEFENASFAQFFELLAPWRTRVAHAVTDALEFVNFDAYAAQIDIGPVANLTDMAARQILIDEIELWGQIRQAKGDGPDRR